MLNLPRLYKSVVHKFILNCLCGLKSLWGSFVIAVLFPAEKQINRRASSAISQAGNSSSTKRYFNLTFVFNLYFHKR